MIRDLIGAGNIEVSGDVLVIGAGTVGLVLATELAARGKRVICVESGAREQEGDAHPLNATEQAGMPYAGAASGRFRCLGGTSTRWGGALIPFQAPDMSNAGWPIQWEELAPYVPAVEKLFGLPPGPYEDPDLLPNADFIARLAKWPPFRKRNVYSLLRNKAEAADGPAIWINATATQYTVLNGRLASVQASAVDGSKISISTAQIVIAAGAIESTRILLLMERQNPGCLKGKGLGEGFHDHLSAVVAELDVTDRNALNKIVGFQFSPGGGMRNLRFELGPVSELRNSVVPCFAHIGFSESKGGFLAVRHIYRALQLRTAPGVRVLIELLVNIPWLIRALWWRVYNRRLLFPASAVIQVNLVTEQKSRPENFITLSNSLNDEFGLPLAKITWQVFDDDVYAMRITIDAFEKAWASSSLATIASIRRRRMPEIAADLAAGGGIYHPGGTTRMGLSAEGGVVDSQLGVFGFANLAVCATSTLPTGGGTNPTMMALLLALRYVDKFN